MVREGSNVRLGQSGQRAVVRGLLGEGGQGSVYEVSTDEGESLALKWYHNHTASSYQRRVIADLVQRGAPNERFLWPIALAEDDRGDSFGYVMRIRPPSFVGLSALLNGAVDTTLRSVCTLGYELADSFLMLHTQGLCYRDISFGNIFFDPLTGDVLICDNDNVGVDGAMSSAVMGTRRFMAPEIVRRKANPSTDTDLYSLSVLLFYLMMIGHPLLGAREQAHAVWNEAAESELFGERPLFVFDPQDWSNRPVPGVHDAVLANWPIYTSRLRSIFTTAFTDGIRDPENGRVRESQWRSELIRTRDMLAACFHCRSMNFFDSVEPTKRCWSCGSSMRPPVTLTCSGTTIVLNEGSEITAHHLGTRSYDFGSVVGRVVRHPSTAGAWGLMNVSETRWTVTLPDEGILEVEPGRSVGLIADSNVDFGPSVGHIADGD